MKAQNQAISMILFTIIILSLVLAAYMWGRPMIEKRTTMAEFQSSLNFILEVDRAITDVVNTRTSEEIDIRGGAITVIPYDSNNPDNNTIIYEIAVSQPLAYNTSTLLIKTESSDPVGVYGESEPRIISMHIESSGSMYVLTFKIKYRELDSASKGYMIAIKPTTPGVAYGINRIIASYDTKQTTIGGAQNGGNLDLNIVKITVV